MPLNTSKLHEEWTKLYDFYLHDQVVTLITNYPSGGTALEVNFRDIETSSPELAGDLLYDAPKVLKSAKDALDEFVKAVNLSEQPTPLTIVIRDLPPSETIPIGALGTRHEGRLVALDGVAKRVTGLIPNLITGVFRCRTCNMATSVNQVEDNLSQPGACANCQGTSWRLDLPNSITEDIQRADLQERPDNLTRGRQPDRIVVEMRDSLLRGVVPGDRVVFVGTLRLKARKGRDKGREMDTVFDAHGVVHHDKDYSDIKVTPEFEEKAKAFAAEGDVVPRLVRSAATSIYGLTFEKTAIMLSLFGGTNQKRPDGTVRRGHIHVLLVGDPGTGKSQLIHYFNKLAPRSVMANGKGASGVGLIAAVVKDELSGKGGFTVEAGAMVLANGGTVFLDELDKLDEKDRSAMHEALEQSSVTINKAGLNMTLNASCNMVAAANPTEGKFDRDRPMAEQLNLTPALISRFDLIFTLVDKPDQERDKAMVEHMVGNMVGAHEPELTNEFIRTYIAYARRFVPVAGREVYQTIQDYFLGLRHTGENVTARQFEALVRLSEAHAKANLRAVVTREDTNAALTIHRAYLETQGIDPETGKVDLGNMSGAGGLKSQHDRIEFIYQVIKRQSEEKPEGYTTDTEVINEAAAHGIKAGTVHDIIRELTWRTGRVLHPTTPDTLKPL